MAPAVTLPGEQAGALEHAEVLRHRRQRDVEGFRQLGHRGLAHREAGQHRAPGRIGERAKGRVEGARGGDHRGCSSPPSVPRRFRPPRRLIINRVVNY